MQKRTEKLLVKDGKIAHIHGHTTRTTEIHFGFIVMKLAKGIYVCIPYTYIYMDRDECEKCWRRKKKKKCPSKWKKIKYPWIKGNDECEMEDNSRS